MSCVPPFRRSMLLRGNSSSRYETAISVALGSYMDAIVVKDDTTAIQCIEYTIPAEMTL